MYTVEFFQNAAVVTVLDEYDNFEDVQIIIDEENTVYLRQWNEDKNEYDLLELGYKQFLDMAASLNSPEGFHQIQPEAKA